MFAMQYRVAHMFVVMKMSQQHTTGEEGIEVVENRPFEDNALGKGRYTKKNYRLQRYLDWRRKLKFVSMKLLLLSCELACESCKSVCVSPLLFS